MILQEKSPWFSGLLIFGTIIIIALLVGVFTMGDKGLLNLFRLQQRADKLETQLEKLEQDNGELRRKINNLRRNPDYIEKIARDELGLAFEGEQIFTYDTSLSLPE